jgi:hypothetical protein
MALVMAEGRRRNTPDLTPPYGIAFIQLRQPRFWPNLDVVDGIRKLRPALELAIRQEIEEPGVHVPFVVACIGANEHIALGMVRHRRPFDFVLPEQPDLPLDTEAEVVPCVVIEKAVEQMAATNLEILANVQSSAKRSLVCVGPPPPIGDNAFLLAQKSVLADRVREHGVSAPLLRQKLWRLVVGLYRQRCEALGIAFLPPPPEALDNEGFMTQECWHTDGIHGNPWYGELLLRRIDALLSRRGSPEH